MSRVTFVQQLHLVGFTTDHRSLIFSVRRGAKSGSYEIAVDEELLAAVAGARAWLAEAEADAAGGDGDGDGLVPEAEPRVERPSSALTVREVQARLRRGLTVEQVAAHAGVEPSWIARFAAPVLAEQSEIIRTVRETRFVKARLGPSSTPLGESVYRNLVDRGVLAPREELDRAWRARQLADGRWLVSFRYASRGRTLEPSWEYDAETGQLAARDRLSAQLAHRPGPVPPARAAAPATKGTKGVTTSPSARSRSSSASSGSKRADTPSGRTRLTPARTAPEQAAAKRLAMARKAARARMEAEAERATRRNAKVARKAAKRPPRILRDALVDHASTVDDVVLDGPVEVEEVEEVEQVEVVAVEVVDAVEPDEDVAGEVLDVEAIEEEPVEEEAVDEQEPELDAVAAEDEDELADAEDFVEPGDVEPEDLLEPDELDEPEPLFELWSGEPEPELELEPPPVPVLVFDDVAPPPAREPRPRRVLRVRQPAAPLTPAEAEPAPEPAPEPEPTAPVPVVKAAPAAAADAPEPGPPRRPIRRRTEPLRAR
jgi:hypothetical protein